MFAYRWPLTDGRVPVAACRWSYLCSFRKTLRAVDTGDRHTVEAQRVRLQAGMIDIQSLTSEDDALAAAYVNNY